MGNNRATGISEGVDRFQANACVGPSDEYNLVVQFFHGMVFACWG